MAPMDASAGANGQPGQRPCVAVIGAGPAGAVTAAVLLQRGASVKWIDETFEGAGGMSRWAEVPANTKIDLLEHAMDTLPGVQEPLFADVRKAFAQLGSPPGGWALQVNGDPAPKGWCHLQQLCAAVSALTAALRSRYEQVDDSMAEPPRLECHTARASSLSHSTMDGLPTWVVTLGAEEGRQEEEGPRLVLDCDAVVLATGGRAREPPPELQVPGASVIPQEDALSPSRLRSHLERRQASDSGAPGSNSVAVVGNSHSAFVVVENLYELGCRDVTVFARRPPRFAVWDPEQRLYVDNAYGGLKGRSADFAMRHVLGMVSECGAREANTAAATMFSLISTSGHRREAKTEEEKQKQQPHKHQGDGEEERLTAEDASVAGSGGWLRLRDLSCLRDELQDMPPPQRSVVYAIGFDRLIPDIYVDGNRSEVPGGFEGYDSADGAPGQLRAVPATPPCSSRAESSAPSDLRGAYGNGLAFPGVDNSSSRNGTGVCGGAEAAYEAASIPIFVRRAIAIADHLGLPSLSHQ